MVNQFHGTWGRRVVTFQTDAMIATILFLRPNKRCSWHYHKTAFNQFYVIKGRVYVKSDIGPEGELNTTQLDEGHVFTVQPGVRHEFSTDTLGAVVEEIAYVKYDASDIYREVLGGNVESPKIQGEGVQHQWP